jgi:hypothetical protein
MASATRRELSPETRAKEEIRIMSAYVRDYAVVQVTEQDGGVADRARPQRVAAHVLLQPVAAPSVLGLFGFAGATQIVAANQAGWSTATATANLIGSTGWAVLGGWLFIVAAALAWYTGAALLAESTFGREVLPLFKTERARGTPVVSAGIGEPGVRHGQ